MPIALKSSSGPKLRRRPIAIALALAEMTPQRIIVGRLLDNSHNEIVPHPRNSFSTLMMIRVREIKCLRATVIAKALGIGRASVYRVLEAAPAG
jgi:hypothetical protein